MLSRPPKRTVRAALAGTNVTDHPHIHCWREAYRSFGAKPKKYLSSIENLVRRTLEGEPIRPILPLVDIYNAVSLEHLLPVGGGRSRQHRRRHPSDARLGERASSASTRGSRSARAKGGGSHLYRRPRRDLSPVELERSRPHEAHRVDAERSARPGSTPSRNGGRAPRGHGSSGRVVRLHMGASVDENVLDRNHRAV